MTNQPAFSTRGLEFHGKRMWNWHWVLEALDFMEHEGMNALVFHQNDLIDQLVVPFEYLTVDDLWRRWPVRYHTIDNNRQYVSQVIRHCHERGIRFYLEVKEISFHESILEVEPEVLSAHGGICPSHPFWGQFLTAKMAELCDALPDLDGVIVSLATRESKVSISTNQCSCERCQVIDPVAWYEHLVAIMFEPLNRSGKLLSLRDFSYDAKEQGAVIEAASRVSSKIAISLKNTPHDYYPTFPNNPKIGHVGDHPQWVEFDVWGQFFGLGVFPCVVLDDLTRRLDHCARHGVSGVVARTDWEVISDAGVLDSLNMVNLVGFALASRDSSIGLDQMVAHWMEAPVATPFGLGREAARFMVPDASEVQQALHSVMVNTWPVLRQSVFVLDHVFHEDGMFPDTLSKAYMMLVEVHGIAEWDSTRVDALAPSVAKLVEILSEKQRAVVQARQLRDKVQSLKGDLEPDGWKQLSETFDLLTWYVEGFQRCAEACFSTKFALEVEREVAHNLHEQATKASEALEEYARRLDERLAGTWYPHQVYWLLDTKRLRHLKADLDGLLAGSGRDLNSG